MPRKVYCDRCDGCGWYEGGKTLQTTCEACKGTGVVEDRTALEAARWEAERTLREYGEAQDEVNRALERDLERERIRG